MKKRKNFVYIIIGILILILSIYSLRNGHNVLNKESYVIFENQKKVKVEIADNDKERTYGLMNREKLDYNSGMIFIFNDEKIRNFWMKNTLIPLDIIFVDSNLTIVNIANAEPCKSDPCSLYNSEKETKYVIEVNLGYTKDNRILTGQKIKLFNI